jgi:hypothetical protein
MRYDNLKRSEEFLFHSDAFAESLPVRVLDPKVLPIDLIKGVDTRSDFLSFLKDQQHYLFSFLILLQILDALLTYLGVSRFGPDVEFNPLIRTQIESFGSFVGIFSTKLLAIFVIGLLWQLKDKVSWIRFASSLLCVYYLSFAVLPWTYLLLVI